jgi:hypothetical protein
VTNTCALTIAPIKVGQALGRIDPDLPAEVLLPIEFQMLMTEQSAAERLPSGMLIDIALCEDPGAHSRGATASRERTMA